MNWNLSIQLESTPQTIRAVRKMFYSALVNRGAPDEEARLLEFAIGELLTNAQRHAYPGTRGPLTVDLAFDLPTVVFTVHDHGAFVSLPTVPTTLPESSEGRGLYAIGVLMDSVDIQRNGNGAGVRVTVTKRLSQFHP